MTEPTAELTITYRPASDSVTVRCEYPETRADLEQEDAKSIRELFEAIYKAASVELMAKDLRAAGGGALEGANAVEHEFQRNRDESNQL